MFLPEQVICKNKREGKQLAAQSILQKLHPYITCWGSLLRLYGTNWKAIKEKVGSSLHYMLGLTPKTKTLRHQLEGHQGEGRLLPISLAVKRLKNKS